MPPRLTDRNVGSTLSHDKLAAEKGGKSPAYDALTKLGAESRRSGAALADWPRATTCRPRLYACGAEGYRLTGPGAKRETCVAAPAAWRCWRRSCMLRRVRGDWPPTLLGRPGTARPSMIRVSNYAPEHIIAGTVCAGLFALLLFIIVSTLRGRHRRAEIARLQRGVRQLSEDVTALHAAEQDGFIKKSIFQATRWKLLLWRQPVHQRKRSLF